MDKGQQAVSAILISGILIGVVGSVYFWGIPLVQKSRDTSVLENAEALVFLIDQKIKAVAASGGRENVKILESGTLAFSSGKIAYTVPTDGTIYATDADIPLGRTANCDDTRAGTFGQDDSAVICVTSRQQADAKYENTYSLSYRSLVSGLKTYKIALEGAASSGSRENSVVIQNKGTTETTEQGKQVVTVRIGITIE